ncbi:MAG: hypothetical protein R6U19_08415, partial [Bacteroidales bacterium]
RAALVPPDMMLAAMASAMYADGEIDDREREMIRSFRRKRKIRPRKNRVNLDLEHSESNTRHNR